MPNKEDSDVRESEECPDVVPPDGATATLRQAEESRRLNPHRRSLRPSASGRSQFSQAESAWCQKIEFAGAVLCHQKPISAGAPSARSSTPRFAVVGKIHPPPPPFPVPDGLTIEDRR